MDENKYQTISHGSARPGWLTFFAYAFILMSLGIGFFSINEILSNSQGTLDRSQLLSKLALPLIFICVGVALLVGSKKAKISKKTQSDIQNQYPNSPWMWRKEWQEATIKSSNKGMLWGSIVFALFWSLISFPIAFLVTEDIFEKKQYAAAFVYLFPLVGLGLIYWAIKNFLRWRRFGESEFILQELPVRLGKTMRGTLQVTGNLPASSECKIRLMCIHRYQSGSGDNKSTREDVIWEDEQRLTIDSSNLNQTIKLPIVFKVPNKLPASDWSNSSNKHLWRLTANSEITGIDYSAQFELPVFPADENENSAEADEEEQFFSEMLDDEANIDTGDWSRLGIFYDKTVQGTQYTFARARLKSTAFMLTFMSLIFGGIGVAMFIVKNGSLVIGIVFSLFGFFMAWGALHQWLNKSSLTVSHNKLHIQSGWFMTKQQNFELNDIKRIYKKSNMSSGTVKYYAVYIDTYKKDKIKLAENLVGNRDIDSLIEKISDEIGLKVEED